MACRRSASFPHPLYSRDFAIVESYLFGRLKQQLSGRTVDSEQNGLERVTDALSELPLDDMKNAFLHWKERY
jgi:hypothetical protein